MADFLRSIKNGVLKKRNAKKEDVFRDKIHLQRKHGEGLGGPMHTSPERPTFRSNKIGPMNKIIKATNSSRQVMRSVSGLGMIDPVYGVEQEVATTQHPSNIFDDMDFAAIPEDMREGISCCSDHTADENDGLDMEKFQQNLSADTQQRPQAWQSCVTTLSSRNFSDAKQRALPCAQVIYGDIQKKPEAQSISTSVSELPELTAASSQSTNPGSSTPERATGSPPPSRVRSKSPTKQSADMTSNRNAVRSPRKGASYRLSPRKSKSDRHPPGKSSSGHQPPASTIEICGERARGAGAQLPPTPLDVSESIAPDTTMAKKSPSSPMRGTSDCRSKVPTKPNSDRSRSKTPTKPQRGECRQRSPSRSRTPVNSCRSNSPHKTKARDCCASRPMMTQSCDHRPKSPSKAQQHDRRPKTPTKSHESALSEQRARHSAETIACKNNKNLPQPPKSSDATFESKEMSSAPSRLRDGTESDHPKHLSSNPSRSKSPVKANRQRSIDELVCSLPSEDKRLLLSSQSLQEGSSSDAHEQASSNSSRSKSPTRSRRQLSGKELARPSPRNASIRRSHSLKKSLSKSPHQAPASTVAALGEKQQKMPSAPVVDAVSKPTHSTSHGVRIPVRVVSRPESPTKVRCMSPRKKSRENIHKANNHYQPPPCLTFAK